MHYDRTTRILHALIALGIVVQLLLSLWMGAPVPHRHRTPLELQLFAYHRYVGMSVLVLLAIHWLWLASGSARRGLGYLFPWATAHGRRELINSVKGFSLAAWAENDSPNAFVGLVHGLGFLVATFMVVTGAILFFGMSPTGATSPSVHTVKEIHSLTFGALLMWMYLAGHAGMAIVHQLMGHKTISRMFNLTQP
jgi:cytochrome b561